MQFFSYPMSFWCLRDGQWIIAVYRSSPFSQLPLRRCQSYPFNQMCDQETADVVQTEPPRLLQRSQTGEGATASHLTPSIDLLRPPTASFCRVKRFPEDEACR
jgi:hypothetical protein